MKIPVIYQPEPQEVEVDVTMQDIRAALGQEPDSCREALSLINCFSVVMKAVDDGLIAQMTDSQRTLIRGFFLQQAERFGHAATPPG